MAAGDGICFDEQFCSGIGEFVYREYAKLCISSAELPIFAECQEQVILRFEEGGGRRRLPPVQKVSAMSIGLSLLICLTLICIQVATLWIVCHRHGREMATHVGVMAILTAAMQPRETRAHCRRVADISEKIAQELRLPAKRLALVHAIGILHEIDGIDSIISNTSVEFAILDVADYYDILTHDGGESMGTDEAIEEIRRRAGPRFDPAVVKGLMAVMQRQSMKIRIEML